MTFIWGKPSVYHILLLLLLSFSLLLLLLAQFVSVIVRTGSGCDLPWAMGQEVLIIMCYVWYLSSDRWGNGASSLVRAVVLSFLRIDVFDGFDSMLEINVLVLKADL